MCVRKFFFLFFIDVRKYCVLVFIERCGDIVVGKIGFLFLCSL